MKHVTTAGLVETGGPRLSCILRRGGGDAVLFIHGLGADKGSFECAFYFAALRSHTLLAPALVGFGASDKPDDFSYTMEDQALVLADLVDALDLDAVHLVAHSMGGIVGLRLCERLPGRVKSFTNAEGNLTAEDCTLSRHVIVESEDGFASGGFARFLKMLEGRLAGPNDFAGARYLAMVRRSSARAFYRSSVSTVAESDSGRLLPAFINLAVPRCYLYGEKNRGRFPAEAALEKARVPVRFIPESGHSMMDDNPDAFYEIVSEMVRAG